MPAQEVQTDMQLPPPVNNAVKLSPAIPLPSITQTGPLFHIPTELRTKILQALLCHDLPIRYVGDVEVGEPWESKWIGDRPELKIMSTCRQLYHEAAPIFFASNTFEVFMQIDDDEHGGYGQPCDEFEFVGFKDVDDAFAQCPNFRRVAHLHVLTVFLFVDYTYEVLQRNSPWVEDGHMLRTKPRILQRNFTRLESITFEFGGAKESDPDLTGSQTELLVQSFTCVRANRVEFRGVDGIVVKRLKAMMESPEEDF